MYQVKPIFADNDLMAKGVQIQAVSTNHKLNFNVRLYNVQPGIKFNYRNSRSNIYRSMKVPTPKVAPTFNDNNYHYHYNRNKKRARHLIAGYVGATD